VNHNSNFAHQRIETNAGPFLGCYKHLDFPARGLTGAMVLASISQLNEAPIFHSSWAVPIRSTASYGVKLC